MQQIDLSLELAPQKPLDWTPTWHKGVIGLPWGANEPKGYYRSAGMFDSQGTHLPGSHCYRYANGPMTVVPDPAPATKDAELHLEGRYLFGGLFYAHFGHFLMETTARLWAVDHLEGLDGIVFYPKQRWGRELKPLKAYRPFFAQLGLAKMQIRIPQQPFRVDEIALPPPAIGIGQLVRSRPEYRSFMRHRLTQTVAPAGAEKIYVSRSALNSKRGRILAERHVESLLEAEGYRIFHPQAHSISEQIAQYSAAQKIIGFDGSALHLAAMVARTDCQVAILNRGPSMNIDDYMMQFESFLSMTPLRVEAVAGYWAPVGRRFVKREAQARLDFRQAAVTLAEAGFITQPNLWSDPPKNILDEELNRLSASIEAELTYEEIA